MALPLQLTEEETQAIYQPCNSSARDYVFAGYNVDLYNMCATDDPSIIFTAWMVSNSENLFSEGYAIQDFSIENGLLTNVKSNVSNGQKLGKIMAKPLWEVTLHCLGDALIPGILTVAQSISIGRQVTAGLIMSAVGKEIKRKLGWWGAIAATIAFADCMYEELR